jgi:NAD(P)H-hydrate repair Nnr-like enzyme with NAD(P)H-hydrate dehydratase domain
MDRTEAVSLLKEIAAKRALVPQWISLENSISGYEVHLKPNIVDADALNLIVKQHGLALKEVNGLLIVYKEHEGSQ